MENRPFILVEVEQCLTKILNEHFLNNYESIYEISKNDLFRIYKNEESDKPLHELIELVVGHDGYFEDLFVDLHNEYQNKDNQLSKESMQINFEDFLKKYEIIEFDKFKVFKESILFSIVMQKLIQIDRIFFKGKYFGESFVQRELNSPFQKLKWNGNKGILIDIFYQLKRKNFKGKPIIPNSNTEIAIFLKQSFENFNNTTVSTIDGQLNNSTRPKTNIIDVNDFIKD